MGDNTDTTLVTATASGGGSVRRAFTYGLAVVAGLALAAALTAAGWLLWDDFSRADLVPSGITVEGTQIGDRTAEEAASLIASELAEPIESRTLIARVETATYELDVASFLSVDASGVAADAFSLREGTSLIERLRWRVLGEGLDTDLPLRKRFDDVALAAWLADLASAIDTPAVDATRSVDLDAGVFAVIEEREGRELDERRSFALLRDAILGGAMEADLPVGRVRPLRTAEHLGPAIHVDLSERRLYLWDGTTLVKTYGVAVGSPSFPTPRGFWEVVTKRYLPTWGNPGSAWAASMPKSIPPGPGNPLGTRALNLSAPGIRIHGTSQDWSIGTAASHGCMRMHRWDVEDLYERVQIGTPVFITS